MTQVPLWMKFVKNFSLLKDVFITKHFQIWIWRIFPKIIDRFLEILFVADNCTQQSCQLSVGPGLLSKSFCPRKIFRSSTREVVVFHLLISYSYCVCWKSNFTLLNIWDWPYKSQIYLDSLFAHVFNPWSFHVWDPYTPIPQNRKK